MTNRRVDRKIFDTEMINKVWEKGEIIPGLDPQLFRKDKCGALMKRELFGEGKCPFSMAWDIDHIKPKAIGGSDDLNNLQPLQWENNKFKDDNFPSWTCLIRSNNIQNQILIEPGKVACKL